ncbi:histidine triad nucleotide-binding protein [Armatimonas sp.]|uniref:histidine triad nucleotide-binding protein n=1 Tax=Armatimonas sp. TaxID=1872638 RepID=UPI00286D228B|nr:histidine triad nucleotide-binding protein [Armatimonas sp.]
MEDTIFGKISRGEIAVEKVYEDEFVVAIHDLAPQAPVHILVIPKKPLRNVLALQPEDRELAGAVLLACSAVARKLGIEESGMRIVLNAESDAGQTVFHLHAHVLGGRPLGTMG